MQSMGPSCNLWARRAIYGEWSGKTRPIVTPASAATAGMKPSTPPLQGVSGRRGPCRLRRLNEIRDEFSRVRWDFDQLRGKKTGGAMSRLLGQFRSAGRDVHGTPDRPGPPWADATIFNESVNHRPDATGAKSHPRRAA